MNTLNVAARNPRDLDAAMLRKPPPIEWRLEYAINGRFLTQPLTGVQRYATEVVRALDFLIAERRGGAEILTPRLEKAPRYAAITVSPSSVASGYIWEQCELPLRARRPILSLCNIGPLAASEQIVCVHDVNVFRCPESYSWFFRQTYRAFLPRLARRATRLTTVSQASRRELSQLFSLMEADIAVLPNGHEHVLDWRPEQSALRDAVNGLRRFVLLIGGMAFHKNFGRVLGLARALNTLKLDIVVVGGDASIFANAPRTGATNVHVLGRVSDDDLALLYKRALCLAFPSRFEGFGLPLLEAMALGCPVVTSPIPSSLEVCGESALFADADDDQSWLRSVERIARSADFHAELAERGRAQARTFSWRRSAQGYIDLIHGGRA